MEHNDNIKKLKYSLPEDDFLNDEFFTPSNTVWKKVEESINSKKKRRFIIWYWILGIGLVSGVTYFSILLNTNRTSNLSQAGTSQINKNELEKTIVTSSPSDVIDTQNTNNSLISSQSESNVQVTEKILSESNSIKNSTSQDNFVQELKNNLNNSKVNSQSISQNYRPSPNTENSIGNSKSQNSTTQKISSEILITENYNNNNLNVDNVNDEIKSKPNEFIIDSNSSISKIQSTNYAIEKLNAITTPFIESIDDKVSLRIPYIFITPEEVKINKKPNSLPWFYGFNYAYNPKSEFSKRLNDNLAETIENSIIEPTHHVSIQFAKGLSKKWTVGIELEYFQNTLVTDYDLNIPYDLNSEVEGTDGKSSNSFYHSLPTLQGNVGTSLTVVRSKNDPITHNENIHVNLETELKSKFISTPIDLRYYVNDFNKGLSFGLLLSPSIEFNKNIEARAAHSFHTYVKEKSLNLTVEKSGASFHLGYGLLTGYRLGLFRNWMLDTRVEYRLNHLNSYNIGRFNFGIGILNRF